MTDQFPILIIIIPLLFAVITPLLGLWKENLCYPWVILSLALCMLCSIFVLGRVIDTGVVIHYYLGGWTPPWGIELVIDHLNALMLVIISTTALIVAVYSKRSIMQEIDGSIVYFYTVFLLQVTGFLGIVITGDMFNLYVFLEITALTGYALIAVGEDGAPFASFRYIIMGTVGACFYLLGVGYLYIATGSLNIADLSRLLPELYGSKVILVAFAFFFVGIAIKMALFPMHVWLPDAYTKAPSAASALIAPLMTKIAVYVMLRIMFTVFIKPSLSIDMLPVTDIMIWLGIAAIVAGAVMALAQTDFKRMFCYIVVAEIGYMVGGTGIANSVAIKGVILHILNDAIMTLGMFVVAGIVYYQTKGHNLTDFKDLFKKMPYTMAAFVVIALSIIGVPPTCGFFSKWYLIQGAIIANCWAFVAALLLSSLINIILFFRIFEIGYGFSETHGHGHGHEEVLISEAPMSMLIPTIITAFGIMLIGIYNQPILNNIIQFAVPKL